MSKINTLKRTSIQEIALLAEAMVLIYAAKIALSCFHFKRISSFLGDIKSAKQHSEMELSFSQAMVAERISRVVRIASRYVPFRSTCFVNAICGKLMLKFIGIPAMLFLGVKKNQQGDLEAHAWLKCGNLFVTGGENAHEFVPISIM